MRNQRGVSALSLMITIVIIILVAGYSLLFSRDTVIEGNIATTYAEIKEMEEAAKSLSLDMEYLEENFAEFELESISDVNPRVGGNLREGKKYYYFGYADESMTEVMKQNLNEKLGVRNISGSYIVAVKDIGEVEVYLVDGINISGEAYYTYDEIYAEYAEVNKK